MAQQKRTETTRKRIREAANRLFIKNGFKETTMAAIAKEAGLSRATLYLYFRRKEDLLLAYAETRLEAVREQLTEMLKQETFRDAMNLMLDTTVRGKEWDRNVTKLAIAEMTNNQERLPVTDLPTLIEPIVELFQGRGDLRRDIPADHMARFMVRAITGALRDWGDGLTESSRDETVDHSCELALDALEFRREEKNETPASTPVRVGDRVSPRS